jgi:ferredoxin-NADP reductase
MIGKHFLVRNIQGDKVARQYTICNIMRPQVYNELVRLLKDASAGQVIDGRNLAAMLTTKDENQISLTIKNYKQPTGLSAKFFERTAQTFEVKGPMGKPMGIEPSGTYVVFAGGTGILPFMDLVA